MEGAPPHMTQGDSHVHRPPLSFIALSVACAGILGAACSGAEAQDVLFDDSASSSSSSSSSSTGGNSNPADPSASSSNGGSSSSSASSSSGGPNGNGDCEPEEEPNDDEDSANVLAPARCGTLSDTDTVDFLVFRMKSETKSMSLNFRGSIRLIVRVAGHVVELSPSNVGQVPFIRDEDYVIELSALSKGDVSWRVEAVEK